MCKSLLNRGKLLLIGKFFLNLLENWYKMRKSLNNNLTLNFKIFVKYLEEDLKRGALNNFTYPNSSKQFQSNILQPNNKKF